MAQSGLGAGVLDFAERNDLGHGVAPRRRVNVAVAAGLGPNRWLLDGFGLELAS